MIKFLSIKNIIKFSAMLLFLLLGLMNPFQVSAQNPSPLSMKVDYGFDQSCKANHWMPIWITIQNEGEDFSGELVISRSESTSYHQPVFIAANGQKEYRTQIYVGDTSLQDLVIRLENNQNKTINLFKENTSCSTNPLIGVVSSTPSAFTILNAPLINNNQRHETIFLAINRIPDSALNLKALDYLLISNIDATEFTLEQQEAISIWVTQGGQLILSGGSNWQTNLAGFEDLLPIQVNNSNTGSVLNGFQNLDLDFILSDIVVSSGTLNANTSILFEENELPLVAQRQNGFGTTTLIAFDPNHPAFRSWDRLDMFYAALLNEYSMATAISANQLQDWGAAQSAATSFPNLTIPPLWLICGLLAFYIVLIGPVNYIVLGYLKKRELAWITTPGLIVLFSLTFILVGNGARGSQPVSNHLAIIQYSSEDEIASVQGIYGVFSPVRKNYHLEIEPGFSPHELRDGSYYAPYLDTEWAFIKTQDYAASTRIDTAGFATLGVQGFIPSPEINIISSLEVRAGKLHLVGSIQNNTDTALQDSVLVHPNDVLSIGLIKPGQSEDFDILLNMSYSSALTGRSNGNISLEQVLGGSYYNDPELTKRADLLQSLFGNYYISTAGKMSFFFIGWDDTQAPYQIKITDYESDDEFLTAYIIPLNSDITTGSESFEIPAFLFDWQFSSDSPVGSYASPYDLSISGYDLSIPGNEHVEILYQLDTNISYSEVLELSLHLNGNFDGQVFPAEISAWNHVINEWDRLDIQNWGDYKISAGSYFSQGNIRLKIINASNDNFSYLNFSQIDFTMIVEP